MLTKATLLTLLAALVVAAPAEDEAAQCSKSHIIGARGSHPPGEACGGGLTGLTEITDQVTGATASGVKYPAALDGQCGLTYDESRAKGIANMRSQIQGWVKKCQDKSSIVLLGYSQGAQVISDLISGGGSTNAQALDDKFVKYLDAVVLIADPAQVEGAKYNKGAVNGNSVFDTSHPGKLASLKNKIVAYCAAGDQFCDADNYQEGNMVHEGEVGTWAGNAVKFINNRIKK